MNTTKEEVEKAIAIIEDAVNVLDACVGTINPEKVKFSLSTLTSRISELEQRDNWKTVEVDGVPKDGVYVGKYSGNHNDVIKLLIHSGNNWNDHFDGFQLDKPNYYREATPSEVGNE